MLSYAEPFARKAQDNDQVWQTRDGLELLRCAEPFAHKASHKDSVWQTQVCGQAVCTAHDLDVLYDTLHEFYLSCIAWGDA